MAADTRKKDANWRIDTNPNGTTPPADANLAVLMDLRDELKQLNSRLSCWEFLQIPRVLRGIRQNTAKPRRKKKAAS